MAVIFLKIKTTKRSFTTVKVDAHQWYLSDVAASGGAATGIALAMASIFNADIWKKNNISLSSFSGQSTIADFNLIR